MSTYDPSNVKDCFPSYDALRTAHSELLRRRNASGLTSGFLDEVETFIHKARSTGMLLDSPQDQNASQALLDYWANALYSAGREPPDATLAEFDENLAPDLPDAPCPYMGLDAFHEENSGFFFGREDLVAQMVARLQTQRFLVVLGVSGSGKSSAVMGGLLPALKSGQIPGSQGWCYFRPIVPGSNPLMNLARLFLPDDVDADAWLAQQVELFKQSSEHLLNIITEHYNAPAVIVVDQFEELFTLCRDMPLREAFADNLLTLMQAPGSRHTVIITMRIDFEPNVVPLQAFYEQFKETKNQIRLLPLGKSDIWAAIEKPAERVGLRFEDGVIDALVKEIIDQPAALPLLQFSLLKLWRNRQHNRVTMATYKREGGGQEALARSAEQFYAALIPQEQYAIKNILLKMVQPGAGPEPMNRRIPRSELYKIDVSRENIDWALERLVESGLVRQTEGNSPEDTQVELAHEALARNWERFYKWVEDARADMRRRDRLTTDAQDWDASGRKTDLLLVGSKLSDAKKFQDLSGLERIFVEMSEAAVATAEQKEREAQQRELEMAKQVAEAARRAEEAEKARAVRFEMAAQNAKRRALAALAVVVVALIAVIFAIYLLFDATTKVNTATVKEQSAAAVANAVKTEVINAKATLQVVVQTQAAVSAQVVEAKTRSDRLHWAALSRDKAQSQTYDDRTAGILLAIRALQGDDSPEDEAEVALNKALEGYYVPQLITDGPNSISSVTFSPDGHYVLAGSGDNMVWMWDAATGQKVRIFRGHTGSVTSIAFSPNGESILTGSSDGTARLWNTETGENLHVFSGDTGSVTGVAFSPDGESILTGRSDGTVYLWDIAASQKVRTFNSYADSSSNSTSVNSVVFSPDGHYALFGISDGTVRLWDISTGQSVRVFGNFVDSSYYSSYITCVAFSPSGRYILTGSEDGNAHLWDVMTGQNLRNFVGQNASISSIAFSPDGQLILTGNRDGTARLWDIATGESVRDFIGHKDSVTSVAFSSNGQSVLTGSKDGAAQLWNIETGENLRIFSDPIASMKSIAFSPDGYSVLTGDQDGNIRLWEAATGKRLRTFSGNQASVNSVAFSPDGHSFLTGSVDNTARLWNIITGQNIQNFKSQTSSETYYSTNVASVAFSPDGRYILIDSVDNTAQLWDIATHQILRTFSGHAYPITSVAFSLNGRFVLTGSNDGTAKLWDIMTSQNLQTFGMVTDTSNNRSSLPENAAVTSVAFSPDGLFVLTGSADGTAKLWDAATGENQRAFGGYMGPITSVAFSPDGQFVLTGSYDGTGRLWNAATGENLRTFSGHTASVSSVAFSPDGRYVLTGSMDGTTRLWPLNNADVIAYVCTWLSRDFTSRERAQFGINDQVSTCPKFASNSMVMPAMPPTITPAPTSTPFITTPLPSLQPLLTRLPSPSPTQALNPTVTLVVSSSQTPIAYPPPPTRTPTPLPSPTITPTINPAILDVSTASMMTSEDGVLHISLPSGWQIYPESDRYMFSTSLDGYTSYAALYVKIGDPQTIYSELYSVTQLPTTPEEGLKTFIQVLGNDYKSGAVQPGKVGSYSGSKVRLTGKASYEKEYEVYLAVLPDDQLIYVVTMAQPDLWASARRVFNVAVASITLMTPMPTPTPTLGPQ